MRECVPKWVLGLPLRWWSSKMMLGERSSRWHINTMRMSSFDAPAMNNLQLRNSSSAHFGRMLLTNKFLVIKIVWSVIFQTFGMHLLLLRPFYRNCFLFDIFGFFFMIFTANSLNKFRAENLPKRLPALTIIWEFPIDKRFKSRMLITSYIRRINSILARIAGPKRANSFHLVVDPGMLRFTLHRLRFGVYKLWFLSFSL